MHKNKKGFTLIEILAAVTILGILSIIAVVSVNNVIQQAKENHYKTAEDNLELAGQSYVQQNRSALPKAVGQKKKISLKTLVENNYIEPIKDYSDNDCDLENSYVQIFKYSQNDYSYLAYLDCPVYDSKEQLEHGAPRVTITLTNPSSTKTAKANIKVEDNEKLLSWSYIVYRDGKEVLNSGSVMLPNYEKQVEKTINISKYTPGKIKVVVTATNIYGLTTKKTSEVLEYKDESAPICIIKEEDKKGNPKPWTQESKTITVGCDDGEGSGCTREEYSVTFKKTTNVGKITIEDESGNKTTCEVSVNVDVTAPECTVELDGTKGDNNWYKTKNVEISLVRTDDHSGVAAYDLTTSTTPSYNGTNKSTQSDTSGITWYGYVKDNVGNVAECKSPSFKVDATKPTCSVSLSGTVGNNGWYKEKAVSLTLKPEDNLSGIAQTGLSTKTTPTLGTTTSGTQSDIASVTWYGRVKDNAGNISNVCNSGEFKVDTTKPTCKVSFSGTSGDNDWYKSTNATVSLTRSDDLSKVEKYGLTTSTSVTYNNSASSSQGNTSGQRWNGYVMDYAGNTNSCNNTVKVDTTKPSCTITLSGTPGNNGWYKANNVSLTLNPADDLSGVAQTGLSTKTTPTLGSTKTGTQGNTAGVTWYGRVKDNAGNISNVCNSGEFKVDTTNPTCSVSFSGTKGDNDWYKSTNATVSLTKDDSLSKVEKYGLTTSTSATYNNSASSSQGNTSSQKWNGYVMDYAGNTNSCNNTVKVDVSKPSCTISLSGTSGNNGWYKSNNVTVTLNSSDTGPSNVATTGLSTSSSPSFDGSTSKSQGDSSGITYYGRVKDNAGNISDVCNSGSFKVDKTVPTLTWNTGEGPHNNSSGITVYTSCTDGMSGVASHTRSSSVGSPTTGTSKTHSCTDNAGNSTSKSRTFKVKTYGRHSSCGVAQWKSCAHSECGVAEYKSCTAEVCGKKTCATYSCGSFTHTVPRGQAFNPANCPKYERVTTSTSLGDQYRCASTCAHYDCGLQSCTHPACGAKSYNTCRTEGCGVDYYNQCWHY